MRFHPPYRAVVYVALGIFVRAASAHAATIAVPAGGNLQAALNAAAAGDVITLAPGATYIGNFVLPNKGAIGDYITIRSAASDDLLPPAGVRVTPAYAAQLPKIRSSNNISALRTSGPTNHWKLVALEFQPNQGGYGDIITLGATDSTQTQLAQVPYAFVLDRLYVHGDPVLGQKRGIALHSSDTTLHQLVRVRLQGHRTGFPGAERVQRPGQLSHREQLSRGRHRERVVRRRRSENSEPGHGEHHVPPKLFEQAARVARPDRGHSGGRHRDACARRRVAPFRNLLLQGGGAPAGRPGRQGRRRRHPPRSRRPSTPVRPAA